MAMTLEQLREKIKSIGSKGGNRRGIWKPTDFHIIRLLPLKDKPDEPWNTVYSHYVNNKFIYCPRTKGEDCVVCEYADKLKAWKDESGVDKPKAVKNADWELFKKIQAGESHWFAMIERKKEKDKAETVEGPFWWRGSKTILEGVLKICSDEGWNEQAVENGGGGVLEILFDERSALDVEVDLKKAKNADGKGNEKSLPITEINERKRFTPISRDRDEVAKILESIPDFDETVKPMTSAEVEKLWAEIIEAGITSEEKAAAGDSDGTEHGKEPVASNNAEQPVTGKVSVSDAVSKLIANKNK